MHSLWDSVAGWQPHRVVSRLFMRQPSFLDQPAVCELLVHDIARKLYRCDGMDPFCGGRYAWEGYAEDEGSDAVDVAIVRTSLRENVGLTVWWRQQVCPVGLLPSAQDAVSSALNLRSRRGALAGMPFAPRRCRGSLAISEGW